MALVECPECKKEVSDSAKICPNCGYRLKYIVNKKKFLLTCLIVSGALVVGILLFILLKPCEHQMSKATCEKPITCKLCGETEGEALGHQWEEATCSAPKTCSVCNATEGKALEHTWNEATCSAPKTCSICNATEGKALEHTWNEATCSAPKTCSVCNATEGNMLEHSWKEATYSSPKTCTVCGKTEGNALVKPETKVVGIYQMSYLKDSRNVTESLQFYSNGTVIHRCNINSGDGTGTWSVSGSTISFNLCWEHSDHTDYHTATIVNGGIMWESSFWRKVN